MNREKALAIAKDLKKSSEKFTSVEFLEVDTEFFDYVIRELERTAPQAQVQEQFNQSIITKIGCTKTVLDKTGLTIKTS